MRTEPGAQHLKIEPKRRNQQTILTRRLSEGTGKSRQGDVEGSSGEKGFKRKESCQLFAVLLRGHFR